MWFKKLSQVLTFLTALVLFTVSSVVAPVVPKSENRSAPPTDAQSLLAEANRLSWLENWTAAGPLYARAELLFRAAGNKRNAIYARIGRIRAMGETSAWEDVSRALQKQLENPVVKTDSGLRLWCLALKGYADLDLDTESAKRSWTEALGIAEGLGEAQWASRAKGELGVVAFLEGNPTRAVSLVGQALLSLVASKDAAGEARLLTMLGDGYNEVHRFAEAHWFFQRAISIMEGTPDAGFPFNAEVGDAQALAGEGHQSQAEELLTKLLSRAKREKKYWHETDVLVALGELAIKAHDMERARDYLERAAELSKTFHLYRDQAMVMIDLAGVYRIQGNLKSADATVKVGLAASRHVGDRYYLPRNLTAAAELKVAENEPEQADLLFEEAEDVIDGMLLNQHTDYGKAALAGSMSETYLKHFHLVQEHGNVARALQLLERVRGRASASRLYEPRDSTSDSPARAALEANIAAVQVSLLATDDQKARLALQDQLLQNERNLAFEDNELSRTQWSWLAPVSLASVQKVLKKDELLLEYVLDDPHAFCIAVAANDAHIIQFLKNG